MLPCVGEIVSFEVVDGDAPENFECSCFDGNYVRCGDD